MLHINIKTATDACRVASPTITRLCRVRKWRCQSHNQLLRATAWRIQPQLQYDQFSLTLIVSRFHAIDAAVNADVFSTGSCAAQTDISTLSSLRRRSRRRSEWRRTCRAARYSAVIELLVSLLRGTLDKLQDNRLAVDDDVTRHPWLNQEDQRQHYDYYSSLYGQLPACTYSFL